MATKLRIRDAWWDSDCYPKRLTHYLARNSGIRHRNCTKPAIVGQIRGMRKTRRTLIYAPNGISNPTKRTDITDIRITYRKQLPSLIEIEAPPPKERCASMIRTIQKLLYNTPMFRCTIRHLYLQQIQT